MDSDGSKVATAEAVKLSRTAMALREYADPKQKGSDEILSGDAFEKLYADVQEALEKKTALNQEISADNTEIDRISDWGDFSPAALQDLKEEGFDFHF